MQPTTMSMNKKKTQDEAKKTQIESDNELMIHGKSENREGARGTQNNGNDSYSSFGKGIDPVNCKCNTSKKLNRQEKAELSRKLQEALSYRN